MLKVGYGLWKRKKLKQFSKKYYRPENHANVVAAINVQVAK